MFNNYSCWLAKCATGTAAHIRLHVSYCSVWPYRGLWIWRKGGFLSKLKSILNLAHLHTELIVSDDFSALREFAVRCVLLPSLVCTMNTNKFIIIFAWSGDHNCVTSYVMAMLGEVAVLIDCILVITRRGSSSSDRLSGAQRSMQFRSSHRYCSKLCALW